MVVTTGLLVADYRLVLTAQSPPINGSMSNRPYHPTNRSLFSWIWQSRLLFYLLSVSGSIECINLLTNLLGNLLTDLLGSLSVIHCADQLVNRQSVLALKRSHLLSDLSRGFLQKCYQCCDWLYRRLYFAALSKGLHTFP